MTDPPPLDQWLARLQAAQPAEVLLRLTNLEAQQTTSTVALAALTQQITELETRLMATAEEFATRLDTASNEIAAELQSLRGQLQSLKDQIPAAQQAAVDAALAQLDGPIARLEALGQDPANPVPPADGGQPPADGGAPVDPTAPDQPQP